MSKIEEILNASTEYLNTAASKLEKTSGKVQETAIIYKNGKRVAEYWNPFDNSKREEARREIEKIQKQEKWLLIRYVFLWIVMIIVTCVMRTAG